MRSTLSFAPEADGWTILFLSDEYASKRELKKSLRNAKRDSINPPGRLGWPLGYLNIFPHGFHKDP